jgi:hypothetical protein
MMQDEKSKSEQLAFFSQQVTVPKLNPKKIPGLARRKPEFTSSPHVPHRIQINSITFQEKPFRKLTTLELNIANHITLISGHNGIGKSTIIGLIAASSGLTESSSNNNTYANETFQADLSEIIYVGTDEITEDVNKSYPIVTYSVNGNQILRKTCSLTTRNEGSGTQSRRARIVPRNARPSTKFVSNEPEITIGEAAKVPLPTIYLGMARVLPIGEAAESSVESNKIEDMELEDRNFVTDFVNGVILGSPAKSETVTSNLIRGTNKFSSHPEYTYNAQCVSLGQDSLGSIAAALASFQRLKRNMKEKYPGGLLIIDELDCGFHPHAIGRLVSRLEEQCERLQLQVIATTHSTKLIKCVHKGNSKKKQNNGVIYLRDSTSPHLLSSGDLNDILDDMDLVPPAPKPKRRKPKLTIYLEDKEALFIFNKTISKAKKISISREHSITLNPVDLGVGCSSLAEFPRKDPQFKKNIICLDGDYGLTKGQATQKNLVTLPADGKKSPENTIYDFVDDLVNNPNNHRNSWEILRSKKVTTDMLRGHLLNFPGGIKNRQEAKKWWRDRVTHIHNWGLFELWLGENPAAAQKFESDLTNAIKVVSKHIRTLARNEELE